MTQASSNERAAPATTPSSSPVTSLRAKLETPAAPLVLGGLALLMSLPSLGFGLQTDDHMHAQGFRTGDHPLAMLQMSESFLRESVQTGGFTWWTSPDLTIRFLRPLSSITHWVEFTLWPNAVWAMHLTNAICYALLVACAALIYRELFGNGRVAGLAALMFAVDDRHAWSAGWISSRNTLLSAMFALLAFLLHVRGRARGQWPLAIASAACTALALLSAEYGVTAFAYLFAYAWLLDSGSLGARARSLAPHACVGLAWAAVYASGHYGFRHSGWYRDPSGHPFETLALGLADLPVWSFSQLVLNAGETTVMLDAWVVRAVAALLLLPVFVWLLPSLRSSRLARFFALGMLLSLAPVFTTHPQGRLLLAPSFGALGWIACALDAHLGASRAFERIGARVMRVLHLWLAPVLFVLMLGSLVGAERAGRELADLLPKEGGREAVLINTPLELLGQAAAQIREERGLPALTSFHQLYSGDSEVKVERIDDRTLDVAVNTGWGRVPFSRLFTPKDELPKLGTSRSVRNFVATVLEVTPDDRPSRVRFVFATPLESDGREWLIWRGASAESFQPPAVGASVTLSPVSPLDLGALPKQKT